MRKVVETLLDDTDNSPADETVNFSLDGERYEIDLSDRNASRFRDQLEPWRTAARRIAGHRRRNSKGPQDSTYNHRVREWAKENGHRVSNRGRISAEVVHAYEAAKGQ